MQVTLTRDYKIAPHGHTTLTLKKGEQVTGEIAEMAIRDGAAKRPAKKTPAPKATKPAEGPEHEG